MLAEDNDRGRDRSSRILFQLAHQLKGGGAELASNAYAGALARPQTSRAFS